MTENGSQSYATHRRTDPAYHYVLLGILGINVFVAIAQLVRSPAFLTAWGVVLAVGLALMAYSAFAGWARKDPSPVLVMTSFTLVVLALVLRVVDRVRGRR